MSDQDQRLGENRRQKRRLFFSIYYPDLIGYFNLKKLESKELRCGGLVLCELLYKITKEVYT